MANKSRPLSVYLLLGLAPWPLVYVGLYVLHNVWAAFALYHGLCLISWISMRPVNMPRLAPIWTAKQWLGLIAGCIAVNLLACSLPKFALQFLDPPRIRYVLESLHAISSPIMIVCLFAYFAFANPIFEELFWRGTIYAGFAANGWGRRKSAAVSSILFGAWHLLPVLLLFSPGLAVLAALGITLVGVGFAVVCERGGTLYSGMVAHALGADIPVLIILWLCVLKTA